MRAVSFREREIRRNGDKRLKGKDDRLGGGWVGESVGVVKGERWRCYVGW